MSDECAMWVTGVGIQVLGRLSLFFTADRWLPHFTHIVFRTWAGRRGWTKGAQERAASVFLLLPLLLSPRSKQLFWKLHAITSASVI